MEVMVARVLVAMIGLAVILGAVLLVLSFFLPKLRFRRLTRPDDNLPFGGGPAP